MIVVDASVVASALLDDDADDGNVARARLAADRLSAPELIDLEVVSVVRRLVHRGDLDPARADDAIADLVDLPIRRLSHHGLVDRVWAHRQNLTPYDAVYVALAEALDVVLVTADRRLAHAPGLTCRVEVVGAES
ncbi:MAG: type II toxin-antitoxin system VapC family toxin [Actinobacteria bacterium]|nr:type II toxin-antitoxin system VapC family toxin [Actinomycetota bacterium]